MAVLVTGGAGYIGSHMALALRDRGEDVVVVDNLTTGFRPAVPDGVVFYNCDIAEVGARQILDRERVDSVIHFAASTVVPDSVRDPLGYYRNNTIKAHSMIEALAAAGGRPFLFSSTAAVYGTPTSEFVEEATPANPESPYGASKLLTERILIDASIAHRFPHAILRYFNVAGADPRGRAGQSTERATHLIKVCVQAALGKRNGIDVYGTDYPTPDGTGVRDYIHVSDLVSAHLLALDALRSGRNNLLLNCGYGRGFSVLNVIETVKRVSGADFSVRMARRRPGDAASVVAKSDRIRAELGWTPRFDDLDTIVQHALAWEKALSANAELKIS
ncbi:MAG: UDP-glucose 4-epimerase GalE [Alphaproteobacteria bacterium]|nr:UDP-glucose 4-epimerase GalE [Alphaproteobacteria bacterium]